MARSRRGRAHPLAALLHAGCYQESVIRCRRQRAACKSPQRQPVEQLSMLQPACSSTQPAQEYNERPKGNERSLLEPHLPLYASVWRSPVSVVRLLARVRNLVICDIKQKRAKAILETRQRVTQVVVQHGVFFPGIETLPVITHGLRPAPTRPLSPSTVLQQLDCQNRAVGALLSSHQAVLSCAAEALK